VGDYDAARAEAERAEAEGTQTGDRLAVGYALFTLAKLDIAAHGIIAAAAKDLFHRALAVLGDEPQTVDLALQIMVTFGGLLGVVGLPLEADRVYAQVAGLVERGSPPRQSHVRAFTATFAFHRGRWDEALTDLDAAAQLTRDATYRQYLGGVGAHVAIHRDDRAAADEYLCGAADIQLIDGDVRLEVEFLLVAWALAAERDADPGEAVARLLAIFDPDTTLTFPRLGMLSTQWLPDLVRLALAVGDLATGPPWRTPAREKPTRTPGSRSRLPRTTARGWLTATPSRCSPAPSCSIQLGILCSVRRRWRTLRCCTRKRATPRRPAPPTGRPSASTATSARRGTSCAPTPGYAGTISAAAGRVAGRSRAGTP
jgi:hypothetical protein